MSHRLFVALRPPPAVRDALAPLMAGIEGARWQTDNQLHLTLAFIGEADRHGLDAAREALATVSAPPLDLKLGQFGTFDTGRADRTGTLWIGVEDAPPEPRRGGPGPLPALARSVRSALRRAGLAPDARSFAPHITLARFGGSGVPRDVLRPFLTHAAAPRVPFRAAEFHLVESSLGREGAHYTPVATYPLGDAAR